MGGSPLRHRRQRRNQKRPRQRPAFTAAPPPASQSKAAASAACVHGSSAASSDTRGSDTRGSGIRGGDTHGSDIRGGDTHGSDIRGSDSHGSGSHGSDIRGGAHGIGRGRESEGRAGAQPGQGRKKRAPERWPPLHGGRPAGRSNDGMRTMPSELGAVATPTARRCPQMSMAGYLARHPAAFSCCQRKNLADGYFLACAQQNAEKKD